MNYYRRAIELLSPRGVILIDNVFVERRCVAESPPDDRTAAIQNSIGW